MAAIVRPHLCLSVARRLAGAARPVSGRAVSTTSSLLNVHPAVAEAVAAGRPVVALESTIISHGMPYPQNVETARAVEDIVRAGGAVPATVAVLEGRLCVGLSHAQLEALGRLGKAARKVSRRDLASCLASGAVGATTVSGTMIGADAAGIRVFVTGGVGGVHRGAEVTLDVSADLTELARTPVAVICAGVKSILDVRKTLEVLETQGVPVLALATSDFPAFFSPSSGVPAPESVPTVEAAAAAWAVSLRLGLRNGMLLAVPTPAPAHDAQAAIDTALGEASAQGIGGKEVTPFLLARVAELTQGSSLEANIALVKNNARVGAAFAVALAGALRRNGGGVVPVLGGGGRRAFSTAAGRPRHANGVPSTGRPLVFGGAVLDVLCRPALGTQLLPGVSSPGLVTQSAGGVGRNIADVLTQLEGGPMLVTYVGDDASGRALAASLASTQAQPPCILLRPSAGGAGSEAAPSTPTYVALLDAQGGLVAAVADMAAFDVGLGAERLGGALEVLAGGAGGPTTLRAAAEGASVAVMDANPPPAAQALFAAACVRAGVPLVFEPISVVKALRVLEGGGGLLHSLAAIKPNAHEVEALAEAWRARVGLPPLPPSQILATPESEEEAAEAAREGARLSAAAAGAQAPGPLPTTGVDKVDLFFGKPDAEGGEAEAAGGALNYRLDARVLAAAQTVLAGMLRPHGCTAPVGSETRDLAWALARGVPLEDAPGGSAIVAEAIAAAGPEGAALLAGSAGARGGDGGARRQRAVAAPDAMYPGGLLDGRKHVWVSLGREGLLWLSAPATADSDLCAALPFFLAAQHPFVGFDFALLPAPAVGVIRKATGAGDTLLGCTVASLARGVGVARALQAGLAGAALSLEADPSVGAVPRLSRASVAARVDPRAPHHEYA